MRFATVGVVAGLLGTSLTVDLLLWLLSLVGWLDHGSAWVVPKTFSILQQWRVILGWVKALPIFFIFVSSVYHLTTSSQSSVGSCLDFRIAWLVWSAEFVIVILQWCSWRWWTVSLQTVDSNQHKWALLMNVISQKMKYTWPNLGC